MFNLIHVNCGEAVGWQNLLEYISFLSLFARGPDFSLCIINVLSVGCWHPLFISKFTYYFKREF